MKIATIIIESRPTAGQKNNEITNPNGRLDVELVDAKTGQTQIINYAQLFREGQNNETILNVALSGEATFNATEYFLDKDFTSVIFNINENNFLLKTNQLTGLSNEAEQVFNPFEINLELTFNDGSLENPLKKEVIPFDINGEITQEQKAIFSGINCQLNGTNWSDFTIVGNCQVAFSKIDETTVFVGYDKEKIVL